MKKYLLSILMLSCILLSACSSGEDNNGNEYVPIELPATSRATAKDLAAFNLALLQNAVKVADEKGDTKNVIVSPFSTSVLLGMVANAIEAEPANEILNHMGLSNLESLNTLNATLLSSLPGLDKSASLYLPNSVWYGRQFDLNSGFNKDMQKNFLSRITKVDFQSTVETKKLFDQWIKSSTAEKITSYPFEIDPQTYAVFSNAMYFGAKWKDAFFYPANISKESFHGLTGDSEVDMMTGAGSAYAIKIDDMTYLNIPFGNGAFNFEVFLPDSESDIRQKLSLLDPGQLSELRSSAKRGPVKVRIPKFHLTQKNDLREILTQMGFEKLLGVVDISMFTSPESGAIEISQLADFAIDEKGVEIQVVSNGVMAPTANLQPVEVEEVIVNRPFLFMVSNSDTETVLLSGQIVDF